MAEIDVKLPDVVSQEGALTENPEPRDVEPEVVQEDAKAQVAPEREAPSSTVPVNEVHVATDHVVTDPSAPEAVIVPPEGRTPGGGALPIHQLAEPRVEEVFADEASSSKKRSKPAPDPEPNP